MASMAMSTLQDTASHQLVGMDHKTDGSVFGTTDGGHRSVATLDETHDELTQMVMELSFQNDYLKAQIGTTPIQLPKPDSREDNEDGQLGKASEQVQRLHEDIERLNNEIQEQRETQKAADAALEHLRIAYSEADGKVQDLSKKLVEAEHKMELEIKERDDKYAELDTKFGRLHKRAKQRIQDVQKEKDDLEARLHDVNLKADQALNQQTLVQQELERTRQQANEALRSMDAERQQLRTANSKLRENIDEMCRSLEAKGNDLDRLQQSYFEKEKMLEETRCSLQTAEEKRQTTLTELSSKYQKQLESLEAQLADALLDRSKAAETISSLQTLLGDKDAKIAEMDASSTGEAVRLGAALEEVRAELIHLKDNHEKERQSWEAACQSLRNKLEASESARLRSEIEAAKTRSQLELELSMQIQLLSTRDAELTSAKDEIIHLESEFAAYKIRAHALLQKKDAELSAAMDSEQLRAQEEVIREVEREVAAALSEKDKAIQDLQVAITKHDKEIAARNAAYSDAEERIENMKMKLDSAAAYYLSEKEAWQKNIESIEESWRLKYAFLEDQKMENIGSDLQKELEELRPQYEKIKEELATFRDIADRTIEEKEKEIAKLIEDNKNLRHSLELKPSVDHIDRQNSALLMQDAQSMGIAAAEQQILILAKQQAQREEELAQSQRHIAALQDEIEELERENRLHSQQEAMLKDELRNMERSQKRGGVDMTYLKNVILKLLETGEVEALLPVVGTLLQFSPEEIKKCQQASLSSASPAASMVESTPTSRSVFSRFSFS